MERAKKFTFTLIELLVVVAIIGILMTILLPALKKAKETSKNAKCRSNMRQIGLVINEYMNDYDGWLPISSGTGLGRWFYYQYIGHYLNLPDDVLYNLTDTIFYCPAETGKIDMNGINGFQSADYRWPGWVPNYAYLSLGADVWINTKKTNNPGGKFVLTDGSHYYYTHLTIYGYGVNLPPTDSDVFPRHNKRFNMLFLDTHVDDHGIFAPNSDEGLVLQKKCTF